jgi:hypothetical protein
MGKLRNPRSRAPLLRLHLLLWCVKLLHRLKRAGWSGSGSLLRNQSDKTWGDVISRRSHAVGLEGGK